MPKSRELMDKVLAAWAVYRETAATFEKLNAEIIGDAHGMQGFGRITGDPRCRRQAHRLRGLS
jgi:hypothetical protein